MPSPPMLKLNRASSGILIQLEKDLPIPLFTRERDTYKRDKRSNPMKVRSWREPMSKNTRKFRLSGRCRREMLATRFSQRDPIRTLIGLVFVTDRLAS